MNTSIRKKVALAGAGAAGVVALGLAVPSLASAEPSPTPSSSSTTMQDKAKLDKADRDQKRTQRQDQLAEALAKELGLDKDKVKAALEKVQGEMAESAKAERQARLKERLAAAVAQGKITQEQADAIAAAAEAGVMPGGFGPDGGFRHGHDRPGR